jgi:hypothetical protein
VELSFFEYTKIEVPIESDSLAGFSESHSHFTKMKNSIDFIENKHKTSRLQQPQKLRRGWEEIE